MPTQNFANNAVDIKVEEPQVYRNKMFLILFKIPKSWSSVVKWKGIETPFKFDPNFQMVHKQQFKVWSYSTFLQFKVYTV